MHQQLVSYLPPGLYEISDLNLILMSLLPIEVEGNVTIDDFKTNINLIQQ